VASSSSRSSSLGCSSPRWGICLRGGVAPPLIGYALVAAGLAACTLPIPHVPAPVIALVLGFGALAEGAFAFWLLVTG